MPSEKILDRSSTGLPFGLLGRHVAHRSQDASFSGHVLRGKIAVARRGSEPRFGLGEAEVEHLDTAIVALHHVVRLQVPVGDAFLMGGRDGVCERYRDFEKLF